MPHPVEGTIMYFSSEHIRGREQISVALEQDHILPLQPLSGVMLLWLGHTLEGLIWAENVGHSVLWTRGSYFMRRPAPLNSLPLTPSTSSSPFRCPLLLLHGTWPPDSDHLRMGPIEPGEERVGGSLKTK